MESPRDRPTIEDAVMERRTESREIFATHRDALGSVVLLGDSLIAIGVPIALWDHAHPAWLIGWSIVVVLSSYGWEMVQRLYPLADETDGQIRDRFGWVSTIAWGLLPWLVWGARDQGDVIWALVFVVVFGIASDLLYQSPTDAPSFDLMLATYGGSYLVAFALAGEVLAVAATVLSAATFYTAAKVWLDVNEVLMERRARLEDETRRDPLTGLGTRTSVNEALDALRAGDHPEIHCAFIDIDDFKHLNDSHGYAVGDAALIAVGTQLRDRLPDSWHVGRFGGDEFVAVGPEPVDFQGLLEMTIIAADVDDLEIAQSLTIGTTVRPAAEATASTLLREAAAALRFAKRLGKHQALAMTDDLRAVERSQIQLGGRIGAALDSGEIVPWAQTIVDLETGDTVGLELLARWVQPDGTVTPAHEFISVIEDQGRGPMLGSLMISHAIEALARPELRERGTFISVNLSARHLYHRRLPAEVLAKLDQHRVAPERLVLEITESQHLPSSPIWERTAEQLRALGIGLAMDDLGAGYATVEQLLAVPFSHVKVDRVLTQAHDRPGTIELAAGIAAVATGAEMTAIIEGIETEDQLASMRRAGYRLGQGYLFHRPEPLPTMVDRLRGPTSVPRTA